MTKDEEIQALRQQVEKLQAALAFWMPGVSEGIEIELDGRAGDDAYLLSGFDGEVPSVSWGDKTLARAEAAESELANAQTVLALEKSIDFIESLTIDPLLLPDDIEMTLADVQRHARIELASVRKLTAHRAVPGDRKFDTARNVTEEEIRQWASSRADDAGYLARKLIALWSALKSDKQEDAQ